MNQRISNLKSQSGVMLIEALVAILIFSVGILGIVGLQASAAKASTDAKYRSEAALLANELIARMWTANRSSLAVLQAAYASPNGTEYIKWAYSGGQNVGTKTAAAYGTVLQTLPNTVANPPTVTIVPGNYVGDGTLTNPPSNLVTIQIFWQLPNDANPVVHNYVTQAELGN